MTVDGIAAAPDAVFDVVGTENEGEGRVLDSLDNICSRIVSTYPSPGKACFSLTQISAVNQYAVCPGIELFRTQEESECDA